MIIRYISMLSILISAYACSPGMGSEPGMAWNWCVNLARYCELHIITEGEFRREIEAVLPEIPQGRNMYFYYNPVSEDVRRMCWNQGDWRFYTHYRRWQRRTYEIAREIIQCTHIDIVHQLNMIGFREPGYLWKIIEKPFVWGPVDAKEKFPTPYLSKAKLSQKLFIRLKNALTRYQLLYSRRVRQAVDKSALILAASRNTQETFRKYFDKETFLLNETGCYPYHTHHTRNFSEATMHLLWVGKTDFRKQLSLAIATLAQLDDISVQLHIVGGGNAMPYKQQAKQLSVADRCIWHGAVSHDEVLRIMNRCHLFFFTSVAEGTPHVVLEAIGNRLPILCFDTCGQGDSVSENIGFKIALSSPRESVKEFARLIRHLHRNRDILNCMSENCIDRQEELSWGNKAVQMLSFYEKIIDENLL